MEKEIFFLFNPDNFEDPKKRSNTYRAPQPATTALSGKLQMYLKLRSAIKRKLFSY